MKLIILALLTGTLLLSSFVNAATCTIEDAHVRATPPHAKNSAAFMKVSNNSDKPLKLISASSDISERVELHSHTMSDGMMKMRQVDAIDIAANTQVELRPGGFHVMFLGLNLPLVEGKTVKIQLHFSNGEKIIIDAPIKKLLCRRK